MPLLVVQGDDLQLEGLLLHLRPAFRIALHPPMSFLHVGSVAAVLALLLLLAPARLAQHLVSSQSDLMSFVKREEIREKKKEFTSPLEPVTPLLSPPLLLTPALPIRGTGLFYLSHEIS